MTAVEILTEIVAVQQRLYDRCIEIRTANPNATSLDVIDQQYLELLRAKLELTKETRD